MSEEGFGGVPSWAVRGAKVVCIRPQTAPGYGWEIQPQIGATYTIREVYYRGLLLEEIVNHPSTYRDQFTGAIDFVEMGFVIERFSPVRTLENDLETHFQQYLKTDHRAPEKADA